MGLSCLIIPSYSPNRKIIAKNFRIAEFTNQYFLLASSLGISERVITLSLIFEESSK